MSMYDLQRVLLKEYRSIVSGQYYYQASQAIHVWMHSTQNGESMTTLLYTETSFRA